jgi:hypothetical protein
MGWTWTHRPKGLSHKKFFADLLEDQRHRVLDAAGVGYAEVYVAYAELDPETSTISGVSAIVYLTRWNARAADGYTFAYKGIGEESGPWATRCPQRILEQLTPTDSDAARRWRAKCWERIRKRENRPRFRVGDLVLFDHELYFSTGEERWVLEVVQAGRRLRFKDPLGGSRTYRVRRENLYDVTVIAALEPRTDGVGERLQALVEGYGAEVVARAYHHIREGNGGLALWKCLSDPTTAEEQVTQLIIATIEDLALGCASGRSAADRMGQLLLPLGG